MWLLVGDLHLTDHARDVYRFGIFDWIRQQQKKYPVAATFLAGDLTDSKDRHSATLVNKVVQGLTALKPPVYILKGNHDYRDPDNPYFRFLNHIDGISFVVSPISVTTATGVLALLPHVREQKAFDANVTQLLSTGPICFLTHQTFDGAIAETGVRLSGLSASPIESLKPPLGVYAGDVHRPQRQGIVTYIGCPYQVRFGDDFSPRSLFIDSTGKKHNLYFDAPYKWSLKVEESDGILNHSRLAEGDQVKLTIKVAPEEVVEWKEIKRGIIEACRELKLEIYGVKMEVKDKPVERKRIDAKLQTPMEIFDQFCESENVASNIRKVGSAILGESGDDKDIL